MENRVLVDYTTLVSAANVLNCADLGYPASTRNPYLDLLRGEPTPPDSPLWLEVACLAEAVESCVVHGEVLVLPATDNDRTLERGRYHARDGASTASFVPVWTQRGILTQQAPSAASSRRTREWLAESMRDSSFLEQLANWALDLLSQPPYDALPDVFSHSQTIYKFDGETIWQELKPHLPVREFARTFQKAVRRSGFRPRLSHTEFFYVEDILAFLIRGLLYDDIAASLDTPYRPHPARSMLVAARSLSAARAVAPQASGVLEGIGELRRELAERVNSSAHSDVMDVRMPLLLASVLRESRTPRDVVDVTLQLRDSSAAADYRDWVSASYGMSDGRQVLKAQRDLDGVLLGLRREFGLERTEFELSLWQLNLKLRTPPWVFSLSPGKSRRLRFIRDLAKSCLAVQRLEDDLIRVLGPGRTSQVRLRQ